MSAATYLSKSGGPACNTAHPLHHPSLPAHTAGSSRWQIAFWGNSGCNRGSSVLVRGRTLRSAFGLITRRYVGSSDTLEVIGRSAGAGTEPAAGRPLSPPTPDAPRPEIRDPSARFFRFGVRAHRRGDGPDFGHSALKTRGNDARRFVVTLCHEPPGDACNRIRPAPATSLRVSRHQAILERQHPERR